MKLKRVLIALLSLLLIFALVSCEKTSSNGSTDTYTITFTNETTSTFTVANGEDAARARPRR